ncbi:HEPN domain-containing protein [uncultured Methanolobus sp.]|uniref:HEPN domain-containing protein n=1 Tax=uncultured Methanolobus sp. TaxID=218300 RepID=UPI002AAB3DF7|nr:HEPN domain-containing protein [uncultured Methanolobus sp.]
MGLAEELLEIAEKDLEASRILYENKLYPQAIFYFAQSVEKANKSMAALTGSYDEKYFTRKIGHEAIKIHQKNSRRTQQKFGRILERSRKGPMYKKFPLFDESSIKTVIEQSDNAIQEIDAIKEQKDDLLFIKATEINEALRDLSKGKRRIQKYIQKLSEVDVDANQWMDNITEMSEFLPEDHELKETSLEFIKNFEKVNFGLIWEAVKYLFIVNLKSIMVIMPLYYLSVITLPLASVSRYPEKGKSPLELFNRKLPLVRKLPFLMEMLSEALQNLKEFHILWHDMENKFNPDAFIVSNGTENKIETIE